MSQGPVPADPGRDENLPGTPPGPHLAMPPGNPAEPDWEPVITRPDPMTEEEREAWLDDLAEPFDPEEYPDPDGPPPPGEDELTAAEVAAIGAAAEAEARAAAAAARSGTTGALAALAARAGRGPGQPGSASRFPGESASRAAAFGSGLALDVMPGCPDLALLADAAAGPDDTYDGACDDELIGVLCAWDRLEAHMAARKLAAAAELIRRRPEPGCPPEGPARMPAACEQFTAEELAYALAEHRGRAEDLLTIAAALQGRLPGTRAALRDGIIRLDKAWIIACATALLDPAEARQAEAMVLGRAWLTPGGLHAAIARAVIDVAPDKARKRREEAARDARVQQWAEDSGNAALMGRELPPAEVLAADQRITAWARQLRAAGLDGDLDVLRARAYLDLLLGKDSRPRQDDAGGQHDAGGQDEAGGQDDAGGQDNPGRDGTGPAPGGPAPGGPAPGGAAPGGPATGAIPAGFAGKVNLIVPLATLLDLADRPAEIPGIGPIDPTLARDLANAAAANPRTTWCVTVTDQDGHAIGHGCARPEPRSHGLRRDKQGKPGPPGGPDPPRGTSGTTGPGFSFTAAGQHGPPGGCGTWRLRTRGHGPDLVVTLDPITTEGCDHRFAAQGHDPGVKLRHLAQIRHATCTSPVCRRPAASCDFEHNTPYEAGGLSCLCNGGPKCRRDHRLKQHPRWKVDQLPDGTFQWTTPSGREYTTEPTRYPI